MMATPPPPVLHYKPNLGQHIKRQEHSSDINTTHHQHQHQHCPLFHHPSCNFMNRNILQGLQGPRESILFPLKETNHRIHFVWRGYTFTSFLYTIIVGKNRCWPFPWESSPAKAIYSVGNKQELSSVTIPTAQGGDFMPSFDSEPILTQGRPTNHQGLWISSDAENCIIALPSYKDFNLASQVVLKSFL